MSGCVTCASAECRVLPTLYWSEQWTWSKWSLSTIEVVSSLTAVAVKRRRGHYYRRSTEASVTTRRYVDRVDRLSIEQDGALIATCMSLKQRSRHCRYTNQRTGTNSHTARTAHHKLTPPPVVLSSRRGAGEANSSTVLGSRHCVPQLTHPPTRAPVLSSSSAPVCLLLYPPCCPLSSPL